jgi:hypothetical protein
MLLSTNADINDDPPPPLLATISANKGREAP